MKVGKEIVRGVSYVREEKFTLNMKCKSMLLGLVFGILLGQTNGMQLGETHPSDRQENDVSGAIWDYVEVRSWPSSHSFLFCSLLLEL